MTTAEVERQLPRFEGLVMRTATEIVAAGVEVEFDDIRQLLRIKVWYALRKFDPLRAAAGRSFSKPRDHRGRTPVERHVYGAVANMRKDIEKRPRRYNVSIDELRAVAADGTAEWFDAKYLSIDAEQVFGSVEDEGLELPSTLTEIERAVVSGRCEGQTLAEIAMALCLAPDQAKAAMRSVREKLADWRPGFSPAPRSVPMLPLPLAEPTGSRPRLALAS